MLRHPDVRKIVCNALDYFDGQRYDIAGYVVMPNHVHVLLKLNADHPLSGLLHSWKSYSAKAVQKLLGGEGKLWQPEYWDRLIRNEAHFHACLAYIENNPVKAKLPGEDFSLSIRSVGVPPASFERSVGVPPASFESGQDARAPVRAPVRAPLLAPIADILARGGPDAEALEQTILARLVALNHERAAEEKRGVIRWLRPEYQAPGNHRPPQQTEIDGTESSPEPSTSPDPHPPTGDWPAKLPAQVAAINKLLPTIGPDAEALAACFGRKNKKRTDQISGILATLKALGHIA